MTDPHEDTSDMAEFYRELEAHLRALGCTCPARITVTIAADEGIVDVVHNPSCPAAALAGG